MSGNRDDARKLFRLSALLKRKHEIDEGIAAIIGRPSEKGHVGEFIASALFDIELEHSAVQRGHDGRFRSGALAGKSVNVKWYAKREGMLDIALEQLPDYFLVLTGPASAAISSRGRTRPWVISDVFLFEAAPLVGRLRARGVAIGIATSVRQEEWRAARIYPGDTSGAVLLSSGARRLLATFGPIVQEGDQPAATRFFFATPLSQPRDVIGHLADGEYHWKRGASAFELAHCWMAADGIPATVRRVLDTCSEYKGIEVIEGFFERRVQLESSGRPSQTDLMVLARLASGRHATIAVEGKVEEPFGDEVRKWKLETVKWEDRLNELCTTLGLNSMNADRFRYQLLHRTASAIYEAQRYRVGDALMLVHSFSERDTSFTDFANFSGALGIPVERPGKISAPLSRRGISLRVGWVKDSPLAQESGAA